MLFFLLEMEKLLHVREICCMSSVNKNQPDKLLQARHLVLFISGPGCSKLTTSLVNVSLKFQTLISRICQYFLLKKCEKLLQCKKHSHFVNKKYQRFLVIKW